MVKGIALFINGVNYSNRLASYKVTRNITFRKVVPNLLGKERAYGKVEIINIAFKLITASDEQSAADYNNLKDGIFRVIYTDTATNASATTTMRLNSNINKVYGLRSYDGHIYYTGDEIVLRETVE